MLLPLSIKTAYVVYLRVCILIPLANVDVWIDDLVWMQMRLKEHLID
jgi:hypothetical protein